MYPECRIFDHRRMKIVKNLLRKITPLMLLLCLITGMAGVTGLPAPALADGAPWDGAGTAGNPFIIATADDLAAVSSVVYSVYWDDYFIQTADINLSGVDWTPIGINVPITNRFTGSYDGGGHTISNLTIETDTVNYLGLFGMVGDEGRLSNITLENASIQATHTSGTSANVGSLAGYNRGTISNCEVEAEVIGGRNVGGLVGSNYGSINNCEVEAEVMGGNLATVGGLVGMNFGFVNQSHSMATVSGKGSRELGGLAGCNHKVYGKPGGVIDRCSSGGSVSVEDPPSGPVLGGFVGNVSNQGVVTNSFSTADVCTWGQPQHVPMWAASSGMFIVRTSSSQIATAPGRLSTCRQNTTRAPAALRGLSSRTT